MTRHVESLSITVHLRPRAMPTEDVTVTVVIPCHNYARFLPAAVTSVLTQNGVMVDVVVVDDASTDDSLAVARNLAAVDHRVRVLHHEINRGPVETFNDGLAVARGEFIVRLDADDLLTPGSLQRSAAVARAYPTVGLVYGRPSHFSGNPPRPRQHVRMWTVWPGMTWLAQRCDEGLNVITAPEAFMRASVVAHVGGQKPLAHAHDMEMWMRLATHSDVAYVAGPDQAWHREHAASLSAREVDVVVDLRERIAAFRELANGIGAERSGVGELAQLGVASVGRDALRIAVHGVGTGRSDLATVAELLAVAGEADPELRTSQEWTTANQTVEAGGEPSALLGNLLRRAQARARWHRSHRRWTRTGTWT